MAKSRQVYKGDFLLSNSMSFGRPYILKIDGAIHDGWLAIQYYQQIFHKEYLYYLLSSRYVQKQFSLNASGSAVKNLNTDKVGSTIVIIPPLQEQERIVEKINELFAQVDLIEKEQNELQELSKQLKQKVLDVAMQGKLVPQDPNDEPASVLLEQIRQEKQKLYEEGKIKKKDLIETEIITDGKDYYEKVKDGNTKPVDVPYELPEGWEWSRIGNVIYLISGRDLKSTDFSDSKKLEFPYITGASNFFDGKIFTTRYTNNNSILSLEGDLLITVKGTIGEMAFNSYPSAYIARQVMALRIFANNYFLKHYLSYSITDLQNRSQSMIPGISRDDILTFMIPIPPLQEQNRIVKKINKLITQIDYLISEN